jgi:hypothetical protein
MANATASLHTRAFRKNKFNSRFEDQSQPKSNNMKTHKLLKLVTGIAVLCTWIGKAQADLVINRFDSAAEIGAWRFDFGNSGGVKSFETSEDAGGGSSPGCMKLELPFPDGTGGFAFTADKFFPATNLTEAGYTSIAMDVKVSTSSPAYGDGSAGYFQLVIRAGNNSYTFLTQFGNNLYTNDGWYHIEVPILGDVTETRAFTIQFSGSGLVGTRTAYVDNLVLLGGPGGPAPTCESGLVVNRFNDANEISGWRFDFGLPDSSFTFDSVEDAGCGTSPGSMKLVLPFTAAGGFAFTTDKFFPATNLTAGGYTNISMDVKVDPTSPAYGDGSAGYFQLVLRGGDNNYTFLTQYADNLNTNNGWFHIDMPITGDVSQTRAITIQFSDSGLTGTRTAWIDNLVLKGPAVIPPTLPPCESVISGFDSAEITNQWRIDYGIPDATIDWASTEDANTNAASGALKIVIPFNTTLGEDNKYAFSRDYWPAPGFNLTNEVNKFTKITMDVKIDPASVDSGNTSGYFSLALRSDVGTNIYVFVGQTPGLNTSKAAGWSHLEIPITGEVHNARALTFQLYSGSAGGYHAMDGNVILYLDNLKLVSSKTDCPSATSPTLGIALAQTNNVLLTIPTAGGFNYQVQTKTSLSDSIWINSGLEFGGISGVVTQAVTLTTSNQFIRATIK